MPSLPLPRFVPFLLATALLGGCAAGKSRAQIDVLRKDNKAKQAGLEALTRENDVLLQEKSEAESDLASVRRALQKEHQRADEERAAHGVYRRQAEAALEALSDSLEAQEERFDADRDSLAEANAARVDSLERRIRGLESSANLAKADRKGRIRSLEGQVAAAREAGERERFAAERMKEELFRRLAETQRELDRIRVFLPRTAATGGSLSDTAQRSQ
jgi:hypothetical protein